ncbi:hypothetical protein [Hyphomicrobium sp.]|uniref:hypothetical protein n=1 Tax=Hyphomicrobium sp. TaxID=82 RepID=UPI0025BB8D2A|nr:hypothetical protein [Hyphomicrobium sp.]MCC7252417.1 hypothetical protein [Hyphomicrobium sp.]
MNNSAAPSNHTKTGSTVTYLHLRDRTAELPPIRYPWTEELERRRKAVARWRGNDSGLKETMMRE